MRRIKLYIVKGRFLMNVKVWGVHSVSGTMGLEKVLATGFGKESLSLGFKDLKISFKVLDEQHTPANV